MKLTSTKKFTVVMNSLVSVLFLVLFVQQSNAQLANGKSKFLGNIIASSTPSNFSTYWNQVTPENAGKWGSVEGTRNVMNWGQLDNAYNYANSRGYNFKMHTLVWGAQFPGWLTSLSQADQRAEIEQWMQAVASRYPNIWAIDVVNEPVKTAISWKNALGGNGSTGWDWVITSFQLARQYFPGKKLLINEYGTENDATARGTMKTIINLLKSRGLIDGIGIQAHAFNLDGMSASQMTTCLNDYATLGLDIYISELDIRGQGSTINETAQRNKYQELFPVMWNHASVKGITLWGYISGQTWLANTGIVNSNGTERLAMQWLKSFMAGGTTPTLSVSPTTVNVAAAANSTGTFNITSNTGWSVSDNQSWLTVSPTSGSNNGTVTVTAQQNTGASSRSATVTVSATGVSSQTVTVTQAGTGGGGSTSVWLEAECASVGSLWNKPTDAAASNSRYVTIQAGNNSTASAPTNTAGYINFSFSVSASGTYRVFARVKHPTANDDSWWVRMDGGSWVTWNNFAATSWTWGQFPNTFSLTAGSHTLTFAYREDGAQLDKVNITTSTTAPTGTGSTAENLCTPKFGEVEQIKPEPPKGFELTQNYPNPFNPSTVISFGLPENSYVSVKVYNSLGEEIAELTGREYSAGWHSVTFDASELSSGVYFYAIKAGKFSTSRKMLLQK